MEDFELHLDIAAIWPSERRIGSLSSPSCRSRIGVRFHGICRSRRKSGIARRGHLRQLGRLAQGYLKESNRVVEAFEDDGPAIHEGDRFAH